jgi:AcrR family transcriptional regulator
VAGEESDELGPLPAGRHGFSRDQIAHNQRERLIAALAQVVNERGYNAVTIADITAAAQVSRRTFYEHFESREACFLAAFDVVVTHLHNLIAEAIEPIPDWPHRVGAGLRALLAFFVAEPGLARLCLVDSVTAGPAVTERYREAIIGFAPLLRAGRAERAPPRELPDSTEDTVIGSIASVATRAIVSGEIDTLEELLPDFTRFALTPYIGPEAAREIAAETAEEP